MNNEEGVKERIRRRLLEAADADDLTRIRQQLKEEDEKPGTIDAVVHELRKKGLLKFDDSRPSSSRSGTPRDLVPAMQSFIEEVYVPRPVDGRDGYWDGYEAGTRRARQDLFLSLLALQQLSSLGVQQAQPLVAMAKELRSEVNPSEVAQAAAQQTLNAALPHILSTVREQAVAASPDPVSSMMTRLIEPYLQQMMGMFMGGFGMPGGMMGSTPAQPRQPQQPPPGQPPQGQVSFRPPPGPGQATEEEVKEAFGDV